jgi:hypothetical protein
LALRHECIEPLAAITFGLGVCVAGRPVEGIAGALIGGAQLLAAFGKARQTHGLESDKVLAQTRAILFKEYDRVGVDSETLDVVTLADAAMARHLSNCMLTREELGASVVHIDRYPEVASRLIVDRLATFDQMFSSDSSAGGVTLAREFALKVVQDSLAAGLADKEYVALLSVHMLTAIGSGIAELQAGRAETNDILGKLLGESETQGDLLADIRNRQQRHSISPFVIVDEHTPHLRAEGEIYPIPSWEEFLNGSVPASEIDDEVYDRLSPGRALTLIGNASVGKSMLAMRMAARYSKLGVASYYVDLGAAIDADAIMAVAMDLASQSGLIIVDNAHRDSQFAGRLIAAFESSGGDARLFVVKTRISPLPINRKSSDRDPMLLERRHLSLLEIARFLLATHSTIVAASFNPSPDAVAKWHSDFGGNLHAFGFAVMQSRDRLRRGDYSLTTEDALSWLRENRLQTAGMEINSECRANLICVCRFADQELELGVTQSALPFPDGAWGHLISNGTIRFVEFGTDGAYRRFQLAEHGWGRLFLAAMNEPDEIDPSMLIEVAVKEPILALGLLTRFEALRLDVLSARIANEFLSNPLKLKSIPILQPHQMMLWLKIANNRDHRARFKIILRGFFETNSAIPIQNWLFDVSKLTAFVKMVAGSQDQISIAGLLAVFERDETKKWFLERAWDTRLELIVSLAQRIDEVLGEPTYVKLMLDAYIPKLDDLISLAISSEFRHASELGALLKCAKDKKLDSVGTQSRELILEALTRHSDDLSRKLLIENLNIVVLLLKECSRDVCAKLLVRFDDEHFATIVKRDRQELNGASWVVDKCNSAGRTDFAQKLASHMIAQRSLALFNTSENMALFQLGDVLSVSDIGQSPLEIDAAAQHVRSMLGPLELSEIYSREGSDAVAIGDGLWAISQWRCRDVDEIFWSETLNLRVTGFADQLSWSSERLQNVPWYTKQLRKGPQIAHQPFRQIQFVRLLGAISLTFELERFDLDWENFAEFGRLADEIAIQHPTNFEIVQRHQMQFWTGLRAISQKTSEPLGVGRGNISKTLNLWRNNQQYALDNNRQSSFRHSVMIEWLERCDANERLVRDESEIRWFRSPNGDSLHP